MKAVRLVLFALLLLSGCSRLPEIRPLEESPAQCAAIFPQGRWQLVHAIEIAPPAGSKQTVMGIVQLSSEERRFHCVLMTIEGLVLFEADYNGRTVTTQRALPPLDKPGIAEGMVEDISLLFLAPEEPSTASGLSKEGARVCRYPTADRGSEDILLRPDGHWEIRRYNGRHRLVRTVTPGKDLGAGGLPARVVLKAYGLGGYQLTMNLIEATPLEK